MRTKKNKRIPPNNVVKLLHQTGNRKYVWICANNVTALIAADGLVFISEQRK